MSDFSWFIIGLVLLIIGIFGIVLGIIAVEGSFNNFHIEFPPAIEKLAIDRHGNIYCRLGFYGRIQVYNQKGQFLTSWYVDGSSGVYNLNIDENDNLQVIGIFYKYTYNIKGDLIKQEKNEPASFKNCNLIISMDGNNYHLEHRFFLPIVSKTDEKGHRTQIISTPLKYIPLMVPFPSAIFLIVGLLLSIYIMFFKR